MAGDTPVIYVYLVMIEQGAERRFEEVEAPDIETAAAIADGIVVAMRGVAYRPRPR
ncbi:MAG: hypothetical protein AAGA90_03580 [Actinomycetota bacterium]